MKFIFSSVILFILLISVTICGQNIINFNEQGWSNNQKLSSNFSINGFNFTSNEAFYTNYGYNFNVNSVSLYYVFQQPDKDQIIIRTPDNKLINFISLAAYQVSETSKACLIIEGWQNSTLEYSRSFYNNSSWKILTLDYNNVNKIIIRIDSASNGFLTDYDFDNLTFNSVVTSVESDSSKVIPQEYKLGQNYPNPFNPSTTIRYSISNITNANYASAAKVQLKIYDTLGREIKTLVNEEKSPGTYYVKFNADNLAGGVYFYQLRVGNFVSTKKMLLIK